MRHLIIIKGAAKTGKTHIIRQAGLEAWHVDFNAITRLYGSLTLDLNGNIKESHLSRSRAADQLLTILRAKMEHSEFIICEINDKHAVEHLSDSIQSLCKSYRYKASIIQDHAAPPHSSFKFTSAYTVPTSRAASYLAEIANPVFDISHADTIVAIGDVHAHADTLEACLTPVRGRKNVAFVFTGDYINKGPQPARTLRLLQEFKEQHADCHLLCGNHEMMLERWAHRNGSSRDIFNRDSLPDLIDSEYTRREARTFLAHLHDHVRLHWRGHDIIATHGGLTHPIDAPGYISGSLKRIGVGDGETDIDRIWDRNTAQSRSYQIHGHRNPHMVRVHPETRSFNLEGNDQFKKIFGVVIREGKNKLVSAQGFSTPLKRIPQKEKKGKRT